MKLIGKIKSDIKSVIKNYEFLDGYVIEASKLTSSIQNKAGEKTLGVIVGSIQDCNELKENNFDYLIVSKINKDFLVYLDKNFKQPKHVCASTREERQLVVTRPGASNYVMYNSVKAEKDITINLSGIMCEVNNPMYGKIAIARGLDYIQYNIGDDGLSVDDFNSILDWRELVKPIMENIV